jgi:Skp family chaperone for outer membrane proteins
MADEIATLKADARMMPEQITTRLAEAGTAALHRAALQAEIDRAHAILDEGGIASTAQTRASLPQRIHACITRMETERTMAEEECKKERAELHKTLKAMLAEARRQATCFDCGVPDGTHSPGCVVARAELLLAGSMT